MYFQHLTVTSATFRAAQEWPDTVTGGEWDDPWVDLGGEG
jgi:hypothetical protein